MRLLVVVLAAVAAGFLLGRLTAPDHGGLRGQRATLPPSTEPPPAAPEPSPVPRTDREAALPPAVHEAVDTPAASEIVVLPSRPVEGYWDALLELDFEGFEGERAAWVVVRSMTGGIEEQRRSADRDGLAQWDLWPGTYEVWWFDREGRRLGTRVRIEEGQVTSVRVADHLESAPLPKGLGTLKLELTASRGEAIIGESIWIRQDGGSANLSVVTDSRGQAEAIIAPGRYVLYIGDHESQVVVEEGCTTFHRIDHGREGELVLVAERSCPVWIEPVGRENDSSGPLEFVGTEAVVHYMRPGEYDILLEDLVPLGRVAVLAGRATRFRCDVPKGGVAVRLAKPGFEKLGDVRVRIRHATGGRETRRRNIWDAPTGGYDLTLPPGRYVVTASAEDCEPASAEVDVADSVVDLTLALRPLR